MTEQDGTPLTRRALRMRAASAAGGPTTEADPTPVEATDRRHVEAAAEAAVVVPRALSRRDLRPTTPQATSGSVHTGSSSSVATASADSVTSVSTGPADGPAEGPPAPATVPPSLGEGPLTRREIRLRERTHVLAAELSAEQDAADIAAACRPPFTASLVLPTKTDHRTRRDVRPPRHPRAGRAAGGARQLVMHAGRRPVAVVVLSAGLLTAGVTQVHAEQGVVAQAQAALERAALVEVARQERADGASSDRLLAQAAAYAAAQRSQAVAAAEQAVAAAHGAKQTAAPVLDAEAVAALATATAELAALLEAAPVPAALEAVATPVPAEDDAPLPDDAVTPVAADGRADQPSRALSPEGRAPLPDQAAPTPDVAAVPVPAVPVPAAPVPAAPVPAAPAEPAGAPSAAAPPETVTAEGVAAAPASAELIEALPELDIEVTRRIQEQAAEVATLTAQLQGLTDATIAEAAAAAEAERLAAEAAAQAAAEAAAAAEAELARKVSIAENAPNGEIPTSALCGVGFAEGVLLRCDAAAALERLNAAYRADVGRDLDVVSSYRSFAAQVAVKRVRGGLAAQPGTSNHGRGVAVDFGDFGGLGNFSTANYRWMRAHAEEFGWYHPRFMRPGGGGPQEPWHWEFGTDD